MTFDGRVELLPPDKAALLLFGWHDEANKLTGCGCDNLHAWRDCRAFVHGYLRGIGHDMWIVTSPSERWPGFAIVNEATDGPVDAVRHAPVRLRDGFGTYPEALLYATTLIADEYFQNSETVH